MADASEYLGSELRRVCVENDNLRVENAKLLARLQAPLPEEVASLREMLTSYAPDPEEEAEIVAILERLARSAQEARREALEEVARMCERKARKLTLGSSKCTALGLADDVRALIKSAGQAGTEAAPNDHPVVSGRKESVRDTEPAPADQLNAALQVAAQATSAPQSQVPHPGPAVAAHEDMSGPAQDFKRQCERLADKETEATLTETDVYVICGRVQDSTAGLGLYHAIESVRDLALRGLDGPSDASVELARNVIEGATAESWALDHARALAIEIIRWHEGRKS